MTALFRGAKTKATPEQWDWRQAGIRKEQEVKKRIRIVQKAKARSLFTKTNAAELQAFASRQRQDQQDANAGKQIEVADVVGDFLDTQLRTVAAFEATDALADRELLIELDARIDLTEINPYLPLVALQIPEEFLEQTAELVFIPPPMPLARPTPIQPHVTKCAPCMIFRMLPPNQRTPQLADLLLFPQPASHSVVRCPAAGQPGSVCAGHIAD